MSSSIATSSARGRAAPASSREKSRRLETSRSRRRVSTRSVSSWRRRSSSESRSDADARLSAATRIAVSGERRSWLTARRIAVLTASLVAEPLCRQRLAFKLIAVQPDCEKRGERREEAADRRARSVARRQGRRAVRPNAFRPGARSPRPARDRRARSVRLRPRGRIRSRSRSGEARSTRLSPCKQGDRKLSEQSLLPLALLSFGGALPRPGGELADGDARWPGIPQERASSSDPTGGTCAPAPGRRKLKVSMLATATRTAQMRPQRIATGRTART